MQLKLLVASFFLLLILTGCISGLIADIPDHQFDSLEYTRGGNVTSASIKATGCNREGKDLVIDNLEIDESWPGFSANLRIKGFRREVVEDAKDTTLEHPATTSE